MAGNNINSFTFIEPLGNDYPQTKIERYWSSFWGPFALRRLRAKSYAKNSNMTFLPMEYVLERFDIDDEMPDDSWIVAAFLALVRSEFTDKEVSLPKTWPREPDSIIPVSEDFLQTISKTSDATVAIREATPKDDSPREIAGSIYDILCHTRVGDKKNRVNNERSEFINRLESEVQNRSRLLFVIPGFPFKDQNRFRVPFGCDSPDMAEISFMFRLYRLTQSIYQVHPFGADVVVLTDGELYQDVFGVNKNSVRRYLHRLMGYRNKLNLQATVSFISLKDMIERSSETELANNIINHIEERLKIIITQNADVQIAFATLKQAMKWNYNSKKESLNVNDEDCWKILSLPVESVPESLKETWTEFNTNAISIALKYAAVNLMLKKTALIQKFFPEAIRGTVHPKTGQFALAGSASYAWNGVAWSETWPQNIDDIKVRPYMDLLEINPLNQVVLEHTNEPLFFTSANVFRNIDKAKKAFPLQQYKISNVVLRPLKHTDILDLIELGDDDSNFAWERICQDSQYYHRLLDFRLKHYNDYGFGVYGVLIDDNLIGQAGLQVVERETDQVEIVVFLGKDFVKKGLGTLILRYIISLCRQNDMDSLYGIVRPENTAGIAFTKKFGGVPVNKVTHYSESGVKFKIDLTRQV